MNLSDDPAGTVHLHKGELEAALIARGPMHDPRGPVPPAGWPAHGIVSGEIRVPHTPGVGWTAAAVILASVMIGGSAVLAMAL